MTRRHGDVRGSAYYFDALRYAQSQWMHGKPAQAILQLNKAWFADLTGVEDVLIDHPSPYLALVWIMSHGAGDRCGFMGNPVRHFQHLATRMSGPRAEVRTWRAWACFHLSELTLHTTAYPRDGEQMVREGIWIPGFSCAIARLHEIGWRDEAETIRQVCSQPPLFQGGAVSSPPCE